MATRKTYVYDDLASGGDTNRLPSNAIWSKMKFDQIMRNQKSGFAFFDDFRGNAGHPSFMVGEATADDTIFEWIGGMSNSGPIRWKGHATSGVTMAPQTRAAADGLGAAIGELVLDIDADDDEAYLAPDATYSGPWGRITNTAGQNKPLAIEWRFKCAKVDATFSMFAGLREVTDAATLDIENAGAAMKVAEYAGFRVLAADPDGLDAVHCDAAEVVVKESAAGLTAQTLTAATYVKVGIKFDGTKTYWYVNGQCVNSSAGVLPGATNFPDDEPLMPYLGGRTDATADANIQIDWVKYCSWG